MEKSIKYLTLTILILLIASCSAMVDDLRNCTKQPKYTVEHYQEILTAGDSEEEYELYESEVLYGDADSLTNAVAKSYTGFASLPFVQEKILQNNSSVVKIYYARKEVSLTVSIGDGSWNYVQKKADDSLVRDVEDRIFKGKFGYPTAKKIENIFENAGKKSCTLTKFILSDGSEIETLPETFPAGDESYTAVWEEGKPAKYKVVHHFEKVDCADNSIETDENYELRSDLAETEIKEGIPEDETETQESVKIIHGFTAKQHSEKEIFSNGSTVVDIFYARNPYTITFSTDEGLWNYDEWKADKENVVPDSSLKSVDKKFGAEINWSVLNTLKKTGMNLAGFENEKGDVLTRDELPQRIPASNLIFTAKWSKKDSVSYEVKFMTEKSDSTDSENPENYELHSSDNSKTGTPEYFTEAAAKEIPGFTAREIVQQEIKEDGTTIVNVYYTRNTYKITFDLDGGYWNYSEYKNDKENVTPDSDAKEVSGKFGESVNLSSVDMSKIGKRANNFAGWKNLSDSKLYTTEQLNQIEKFGSSDIIIQAQWEKGDGIEYTVRHWFEKVDSTDSSNSANYELNSSLTQIELGEESGEDTEAVAKTVEGFTAKAVTQKPVAADGSTVVDVYYERILSKFIFDANGGSISGSSEVSGKYDSVFNSSDTPAATKDGWAFGGWLFNGRLVTDSDLKLVDQKFGTENKTFEAHWKSVVYVNSVTTFGDIVLVKDQTSDKVTCSVTLPGGYENEHWTYKWYVDGVYASDEEVFERTNVALGKGVHTITLKTTMNGQNFTAQVTATIK